MNNFIAVGNDELGATAKKGTKVVNANGLVGIIEYGKDGTTGEESNMLGFIKDANDKSYLVSIHDKLIGGWSVYND